MDDTTEYTNDATNRHSKSAGERGVLRRNVGVITLVFLMVYGTYGIVLGKELNDAFVSAMALASAGLLAVGRFGSSTK